MSITYHLGQVSYNEMLTEQIYLDVMHYSEIQALLWPNFGKNTVTPRNTGCQWTNKLHLLFADFH